MYPVLQSVHLYPVLQCLPVSCTTVCSHSPTYYSLFTCILYYSLFTFSHILQSVHMYPVLQSVHMYPVLQSIHMYPVTLKASNVYFNKHRSYHGLCNRDAVCFLCGVIWITIRYLVKLRREILSCRHATFISGIIAPPISCQQYTNIVSPSVNCSEDTQELA